MTNRSVILEKLKEAASSVLPIVLIVAVLCLIWVPLQNDLMLAFVIGSLFLIIGMALFTVGSELSMTQIGAHIGAWLTRSRRTGLILGVSFLLGIVITMAEPDLQVLAGNVPSIDTTVLMIVVSVGVGLLLMISMVRILRGIPLRWMLVAFYGLVFLLALLSDQDFLCVAFDAGGVTTGPMTVPFIMAFGMGIAAIRSDGAAAEDSFGLVALCSVGPILAVLILSMIFRADGADYTPIQVTNVADSIELRTLFGGGLPEYMREMLLSILPITVFFLIFNFVMLKLQSSKLERIGLGLLYTYVGLTVFMTGANYGFMPAGAYLGQTLGELPYPWIIIPVGVLIGYLVVKAEPAVYVLMRQVEDLTDGAITGKSLQLSMCLGVGLSVGLSMLRVMLGINVLWIIVPGYVAALGLSFLSPKLFTAIAFDSGGVASGPMTAAFLLPFAMGACSAVGGNVITDAFGVVAMVAMTPLIAIQLLGLAFRWRLRWRRCGNHRRYAGEQGLGQIQRLGPVQAFLRHLRRDAQRR